MRRLRLAGIGLLLVFGAAWALLHTDSALDTPANWPKANDPALGFYTRAHSANYAGIDRWAQQGMLVTPIVNLLKKDGYICQIPQGTIAGNPPKAGIHELRCDKQLRWPISRTLTIQASLDYDHDRGGRLIAANASSRLTDHPGRFKTSLINFLRKNAWIEAEVLPVRGFEFDSLETLARLAADALTSNGWHATCEDGLSAPVCASYASQRRLSGFAPLADTSLAVGTAMDVHYAMERIHLMPEFSNAHPGDALKLRVSGEQMWVDFIATDLSGHLAKISFSFDSEGGKPLTMLAQLNGQSKSLALSGKNHLANDEKILYLAPQTGPDTPRIGMWLSMPDQNRPASIDRLSLAISRTDPVFIPRIFNAVINSAMSATTPELSLGLYPVLRSIEDRAALLRKLHAERWLPAEQNVALSVALLSKAYQHDAVALAAWALAICTSNDERTLAESACWQRFALNNPDTISQLRLEVADLSTSYATLDASHPLQIHLKKWRLALRQE